MPPDLTEYRPGRRDDIVICIAFHPVTSSSALVGFADLHLGPPFRMRLSGCGVFVNDGQVSVALPTRPILGRDGKAVCDANGKPRYQPTVEFDDLAMTRRFSDSAAAAVRSYAGAAFGRELLR